MSGPTWTPLPKGAFTGIDWNSSVTSDGADPYLIWADVDDFASYGERKPQWLLVAVELHDGCNVSQLIEAASSKWLKVPPVYASAAVPARLRFCTARARPEFFAAIQRGGSLCKIVKRVELGMALADDPQPTDDLPESTRQWPKPPAPEISERVEQVIGLIDDSLAVAHANFLRSGWPRTAYLWRQDGVGKGIVPGQLGYGHELTAADIAAAMAHHTYAGLVDETAVYVELGLSTLGRSWPDGRVEFHALDLAASHGTHVLDLACGPRTLQAQIANVPPERDASPSWSWADDAASKCTVIAVQLDYETVRDTSGGSMNVRVLDALMYILARCEPTQKIAINISFGTCAGPHDGTSLLEAAMDQLLALYSGRLVIIVAAGNGYQSRTHANVTLGQPAQALHWRVQPDDTTPSFLELWVQEGCEGVEIELTPPGSPALPPRALGEAGVWLDTNNRPICWVIYPRRVATGERGTCILLALSPTFSFREGAPCAPSGVWKVSLLNKSGGLATVDAYVERDDVVIGARTGARQSHFEDDPELDVGEQYDMQQYVDSPGRLTPIRRSGNFNNIATGRAAVSVGGKRLMDNSWAHYSPRRPDPDDARPERPGVVKVPDESASSDESAALVGLKAAGTRSGGMARMAGTSDAAPQITRKLLNLSSPTTAPEASSST